MCRAGESDVDTRLVTGLRIDAQVGAVLLPDERSAQHQRIPRPGDGGKHLVAHVDALGGIHPGAAIRCPSPKRYRCDTRGIAFSTSDSDLASELDKSFIEGVSWPIDGASLAALLDIGLSPLQIAHYFQVTPAEVVRMPLAPRCYLSDDGGGRNCPGTGRSDFRDAAATGGSHSQEEKRIMASSDAHTRTAATLRTPSYLGANAVNDISGALTVLLADTFALYIKTKNFHWHVSGPHFRDYHLLLDEQAGQIFATTDPIAERVRKLGGTTLRSVGQIARLQRTRDNEAEYVAPRDMLTELREDNVQLAARMREAHQLCDEHGDVATASLLEVWIDEAEGRVWFLFEASQAPAR
jgi:starvation-inducible DNA-binding protein